MFCSFSLYLRICILGKHVSSNLLNNINFEKLHNKGLGASVAMILLEAHVLVMTSQLQEPFETCNWSSVCSVSEAGI